MITGGYLKGKIGKVIGIDKLGNIEMRFLLQEGQTKIRLGSWWIPQALERTFD